MESHTEGPTATWKVGQCPFTIEYAARVLDDIRLAVVDAFFSLPHGGAEIGGILLGSYSGGRLAIADYLPLDCEHAFGPGFTLSPRDLAKLAELLAGERAAGMRPVGWYHSHTRSEIFLSATDRVIHDRYFPEAWQVALVLRPHTFNPTRAGFFFREASGVLHAEASYGEFILEPLAVRPLPGSVAEGWPLMEQAHLPARGPVITVASGPPAETLAAAAPQEQPAPEPAAEIPVPKFLATQQERSRRWPKVLLAAGVALGALGVAGYQTHGVWLPRVQAVIGRTKSVTAPPTLGLVAAGGDGQVQIRWERNSPAVLQGTHAVLEILDGGLVPQTFALDDAHLRSASFTYLPQSERVDVTLTVEQPGGRKIKEGTSFVGKLPAPPAPVTDPALVKERDDLARANTKLQSELKAEASRRKKLEKSVSDLRLQLRLRQLRRLENQDK